MRRIHNYTGNHPTIGISLALAATLSFGHICRAAPKSAGGSETKPSLIAAVVHRLERLQNITVSKATADKSVRLLLSVPGDARLGPFKTHLMLKCLGYYPVKATVDGYVGRRTEENAASGEKPGR